MKNNITLYSRIVNFKKRIIKKRIIPEKISFILDSFFNNLHNLIIISKDLTKDSFIKTKDLTKDSIIKTRDLTVDSIIKTKDLTKDSIIKTRDLTNEFSKEIIKSSQDTRKNKQKITILNSIVFFPFLIFQITYAIILSLSLRKFNINQESDQKAIKNIQKICVNSFNVQKRVKKYYGKNSEIINPPTCIDKFFYTTNGGFWLSVNRLTPEKRVEIQISVFNEKPDTDLIVVGGYDNFNLSYVDDLKKSASKNIIFLNHINENDLRILYANCKGFIATSKDEDFGMNVVEAMASGKPVIAPNEGGYKETVINGETGILIDNIDKDKIIETIKIIEKDPTKYEEACRRQAKKFDTKIFIKKIKQLIKEK